MLVPGSSTPLLAHSAAAAATGISRSLRFNSSDSAYLSRTPASAGNRKTWTWAGWVKRSKLGQNMPIFGTDYNGASYFTLYFTGGNNFAIENYNASYQLRVQTTQLFRDPSAWFHLVVALDTTQGTASDRCKIYVNGSQVTALDFNTYPSQNTDLLINNNQYHEISTTNSTYTFGGYLADIYFIDGQALTPSSFTETDVTTGQLIPKAFSGSYGSQGWHLDFADNSSNTATTLGKDTSGNSPANNWTPNNLSVTAGAGNDSLVDVPTNGAETDTGAGGEVRGNYATLNPLTSGFAGTLSNGNLDYNLGSGARRAEGTIAVTSGKWWWEALAVSGTTNGTVGGRFGFCLQSSLNNPEAIAFGLHWHATSGIATVIGGSFTTRATGTNYGDGDVLGCALDADANIAYFYKNGTLAYTYNFSSHLAVGSGNLTPHAWNGSSGTPVWTYNFGQRAWTHTPRTNHKALCTANLPAPLVTKPNTVFDVKLYTGTGSSQSITGLGFSPNFLWFKNRSGANSHALFDTVRGRASGLISDSTGAEQTSSAGNDLSSFDSTGFTVGTPQNFNSPNINGGSIVAWAWDAGEGSAVTNTQGSITSSVRANASAGFSVVTWNGNGNATVGHGLGVAPQLIICKKRSGTSDWQVGHASLGWTKRLALNLTTAEETTISAWNNTAPTSTVFSVGNTSNFGGDIVSYCFAPVVGYSSFGSYTGNGSSTDGPFVYTGFRPRWVMVKRTDAARDWFVYDAVRNTYNIVNFFLRPNLADAEGTGTLYSFDFLSNGFKLRSSETDINASGGTYIYAAFAESPFNYARAR